MQGDSFRTNAILVSGVCPEHLSANLDLIRLKRIGDDKAFCRIAFYCEGISFCCLLCHGIGDRFAVLILIHVCEAVGPFPGFVRGHLSFTHLTAVCKQFYSDALRTQPASVVIILPDRDARNLLNLFRCVSIDQVVPLHF